MELSEAFGRVMREARKNMKLSQEELAEIVGISSVECCYIEHGRRRPRWTTWIKICTALEIDVSEFQRRYVEGELREILELLR